MRSDPCPQPQLGGSSSQTGHQRPSSTGHHVPACTIAPSGQHRPWHWPLASDHIQSLRANALHASCLHFPGPWMPQIFTPGPSYTLSRGCFKFTTPGSTLSRESGDQVELWQECHPQVSDRIPQWRAESRLSPVGETANTSGLTHIVAVVYWSSGQPFSLWP